MSNTTSGIWHDMKSCSLYYIECQLEYWLDSEILKVLCNLNNSVIVSARKEHNKEHKFLKLGRSTKTPINTLVFTLSQPSSWPATI